MGREVFQWYKLKWKYVRSLENASDCLVILTTLISLIFLAIHFISFDLRDFYYLQLGLEIGDFAVLFAWFNMLFHLASTFPLVGNIIYFALSVSLILFNLILLYALPLLLGFGFFFHSRLNGMEKGSKPFTRVFEYMVSIFAMMLGNIDDEKFASPPETMTPFPVEIAIITFMIMMCIVTSNVLTGLSVNQVEYFMKIADLIRLEKMARTCKSLDWTSVKLDMKSITVKKMNRNSTWEKVWHRLCSIFVDAQGRNQNQGKWKYRGTIRNHNEVTIEENITIAPWVFEKAKKIVEKLEGKQKDDDRFEKLLALSEEQQKIIKKQNDDHQIQIETRQLQLEEAKREAKNHQDHLDERFEKLMALSEIQLEMIKKQNVEHQKQIETNQLQFLKCISSIQTIQNHLNISELTKSEDSSDAAELLDMPETQNPSITISEESSNEIPTNTASNQKDKENRGSLLNTTIHQKPGNTIQKSGILQPKGGK